MSPMASYLQYILKAKQLTTPSDEKAPASNPLQNVYLLGVFGSIKVGTMIAAAGQLVVTASMVVTTSRYGSRIWQQGMVLQASYLRIVLCEGNQYLSTVLVKYSDRKTFLGMPLCNSQLPAVSNPSFLLYQLSPACCSMNLRL
jgi:hypothetical protein